MVKVKNYEDYFEKVHDLGLYPWYDEDNELVRVMLSDGSNVLSIKTNRTADLITLRQFGNLGYDVKSELLELSTSLALYPTSERGNIPNYENPRFEEDDWEYDDECDSYGYCECHDEYGYYEDCDCQDGFDCEGDEENRDFKGKIDSLKIREIPEVPEVPEVPEFPEFPELKESLLDELKTLEKNELEEIPYDDFFKTNKLKYLLKSVISDLKDKDIHIGVGYQDVDEAEFDDLVDFLKLINEELSNILDEDDDEYQQEEDLEGDDTEHQQDEDNPFDLDEDGIFNPLELSILGEVLDLINDENEFPEIEEILKLEFDKSTPYYMILEVLDTVFEKFNDESEDNDSELINIGDEEYVYLVPVDFDCIDLERLKDGPFFVNIATPSYFKYVSDDSGMSFEEVLECYLHGLVVDEKGFYEPNDNRFKSKITQKDINRHGFKENDYVVFKQEDFEQL